MLKIGVAVYTLRLPLNRAFREIKTLGVDRAEIGCGAGLWPTAPPWPKDPTEVRRALIVSGVTVTSVVGLTRLNAARDVAAAQQQVIDTIRMAHGVGAKVIVTFCGGNDRGWTVKEAIRVYAERVKPCVAEAERLGVTIALETHQDRLPADPTASVDTAAELIEYINHPLVRLTLDVANFCVAGEEGFPYGYRILKPYVANIHLKDVRRYVPARMGPYDGSITTDVRMGSFIKVPLGQGSINTQCYLNTLLADAWDGPISLESATRADEDIENHRQSLAYGVALKAWTLSA